MAVILVTSVVAIILLVLGFFYGVLMSWFKNLNLLVGLSLVGGWIYALTAAYNYYSTSPDEASTFNGDFMYQAILVIVVTVVYWIVFGSAGLIMLTTAGFTAEVLDSGKRVKQQEKKEREERREFEEWKRYQASIGLKNGISVKRAGPLMANSGKPLYNVNRQNG